MDTYFDIYQYAIATFSFFFTYCNVKYFLYSKKGMTDNIVDTINNIHSQMVLYPIQINMIYL